jgi:hypothetical protein
MDDHLFLEICRNEYRAVLQMLGDAIEACPETLWDQRADEPPFWQQAYHALWWLDFYISDSPQAFQHTSGVPGQAWELEQAPEDAPPKEQLLDYLDRVAIKCEATLDRLTAGQLGGENTFHWTGPTLAHRLVYNVRHAQHHIGWLNSALSRKGGRTAKWVITPRQRRDQEA